MRRRRSSASSTSSSTMSRPTITDADDAIVLSDLVRTGEASRLRRRGAMRLDRNSIHGVPRRPPSLDDSDSDEENRPYSFAYSESNRLENLDRRHRTLGAHQYQHPSYSRWVPHPDIDHEFDEENMSYILVCGAEVEDTFVDPTPFKPSALPIPPPKVSSTSSSVIRKPVSNGCGTIIHLFASSSPTKVYTARSAATEAVVPLSAEYFTQYVGVRFEMSPCGCVKEGVGCAVCGNPLGTRWKFCERMAEARRKGPSSNARRHQGPLRPEGPRYWGGSPSRSSSRTRNHQPNHAPCPSSSFTEPEQPETTESQLELYTFFSDAVTAYADPTSSPPKPSSAPNPPTEPNSPLSSPTFAPSSPRAAWRNATNDSDSETGFEFVNLDTSIGEGQEVSIEFGMPQFAQFVQPESPQHIRRRSMTDVGTEERVSIAPPLFDRQITSSPEPLDRHTNASEPSSFIVGQNSERQVIAFEQLMSSLRHDTRGLTLDDDASQRPPQPQPQPMSFYEQQVLGAWERQQERESGTTGRTTEVAASSRQNTSGSEWPDEIQLTRSVILRAPLTPAPALATSPWRTTFNLLSELPSGHGGVVYDFDSIRREPSASRTPGDTESDHQLEAGGGDDEVDGLHRLVAPVIFFDR
ncbi:hypothetical protein FA15DRAFT_406043 [Coprinopsis marcescibilis]|uniref:Uncharacterized protein n=1 Tax=Coprinopsis marcescibilis TaxID=230819 RepID=A0A5C3KX08_COPMA|nr:hypothetical protein FA15DRAFT_406043 [Coprinopsis marcescibilis]